ncbi:hypothetical protein V4S85_12240, partial [Citrobacter freundii]
VKFDGSDPEAALNKTNGESVVFNYKAEVIQVGSTLPKLKKQHTTSCFSRTIYENNIFLMVI